MASGQRAVFFDRDGTLIEDHGYIHEAEKVRLLPGAGDAIARLNAAGYVVVTVSNQSGIARGLYTAAEYEAVQARLNALLSPHHAHLDASYFCPHHPQFTGPCDCRKPAVKLYRDAAADLGLDLPASVWVGDRITDVLPARTFRGRGIFVAHGPGNLDQGRARALGVTVVADVARAADEILKAP